MNYTIKDNSYIETIVEAETPLLAAAKYVEANIPKDDQDEISALCSSSRCIINTKSHTIYVRPVAERVAA